MDCITEEPYFYARRRTVLAIRAPFTDNLHYTTSQERGRGHHVSKEIIRRNEIQGFQIPKGYRRE